MFWLGLALGALLGGMLGMLFAALCAIGRIEELEQRANTYEALYRSACRAPFRREAIVIE